MTSRTNGGVLLRILISLCIGIAPLVSQAEVVVIGHKSIAVDRVTPSQAKKLWLGKLNKLPGVGRINVVDQPDASDIRAEFYSKVVKKTPQQLKAYWSRQIFTAKTFPPKQLLNDEAIVEWVSSTPDALGYVDSSSVNGSVKVLLTTK